MVECWLGVVLCLRGVSGGAGGVYAVVLCLDGVVGTRVVDGVPAGSRRVFDKLIVQQRARVGAPNFVNRQFGSPKCL